MISAWSSAKFYGDALEYIFLLLFNFFVQYSLPIFAKLREDKRLSARGAIRELMSVELSYSKA